VEYDGAIAGALIVRGLLATFAASSGATYY